MASPPPRSRPAAPSVKYCPGSVVTRGQMASFLARTLEPARGDARLVPDDNGTTHEAPSTASPSRAHRRLHAGTFCPAAAVTREQMAAFLHRAFAD